MLRAIGVPSLDALIDQTIPPGIRLPQPLEMPEAESEAGYLRRLRSVAVRNRVARSYIGMGYYDCITPSVILRNVFENPGWYTPYTPYQAEIAQGRLESLLNFQTVVKDLTGMDIATASLLDEGTAAAEAMTMFHRLQSRKLPAGGESVFLVSDRCFPQTLDVVRGRAEPLDIRLKVGDPDSLPMDGAFGLLLQYPDDRGEVRDLRPIIEKAHAAGLMVAVASDLLALTLLVPPGEMGADAVIGNSQRFGVPLGYGGPHAAFLATREPFVRQAAGRIIGLSVDATGRQALRMALQTREQHIRREKATSNICTAQALLANIAAMYAVYHGPEGLRAIAERVHNFARVTEDALRALGLTQANARYFDTLRIEGAPVAAVRKAAEAAGINFRYDGSAIGISIDETTTIDDVRDIIGLFANARGEQGTPIFRHPVPFTLNATPALTRTSAYLTHPVFNSHHSETKMMRYIKSLERKDVGLDTSMIPLGSCTMKLNAASEMIPVSWPEFSRMHPFAPVAQAEGYAQVFRELDDALCRITGFAAVSLQPNSGAQGEFAGLMAIRAYHRDRGDAKRDVVLIPSSAHGTNPASAAMAGLKVVVTKCDSNGNVELGDLRARAEQYKDTLAALMVTYPSTHGVFEEDIREICTIIHAQRRPGLHGRREHERAGRSDQPGGDRRRRLPPEPAQDVRHPARRRRSGHGADRRGQTSGAVPAGASSGEGRRREGDPRDLRRPVGERQHPADLLRLHPHAGRGGDDRRDALRHPQRQLSEGAAAGALRRALCQPQRPGCARDDLRPPSVQARSRGVDRRVGRGEAADGLRLPRADGVVPGGRDDDDRADGERIEGRARPVLRRVDCDPAGDSGGRGRFRGCQGQRPEECATHRRAGRVRRMVASLHAAAGGVSAPVREGQQVLAGGVADRQPVRRPEPDLRVPSDRGVRGNAELKN